MKSLRLICISLLLAILLAGCSDNTIKLPFHPHIVEMWAHTLEPFSADIAFYGDSRVAGAEWEKAFPDASVSNLGVGGDIIEGTIQRLPLLDALDIKYCFLAVGGNNCWGESLSEAEFKSNYETLLKKLIDMGITVYANTIAGTTSINSLVDLESINNLNRNAKIANQAIKELCQKYNVTLIDMAEVMNNPDGTLKLEYSLDGVHFNAEGNAVWYEAIAPYIEDITNK